MKTLGLLRHAKSDWDDMSLRDFDRGLNERGRRGAAVMGGHIREHGMAWDLVLASPAERVRRTLDASRLQLPVRWDEHIYLADSDALIELLRGIDDDPAAVLVAGPPGAPCSSFSVPATMVALPSFVNLRTRWLSGSSM